MFKIKKTGECIRTVSNFSKQSSFDKIDKASFDLNKFTKNLSLTSPKVVELIKTINLLDEADLKNNNTLYKHVIYTDIKKSSAGSKMLAAALLSDDFKNVYDNKLKISKTLEDNEYNNFALLCSVQIYNKPFPITLKKNILSIYNKRPENINGKLIRIIILDQGFKEGIDLFDVKYVHLFENLITESDEKQAIGRSTRYCGQKGLDFDMKLGWPLHIFKYNLIFNEKLENNYKTKNAFDFFMLNSGIDMNKLSFANELELISRYGAVDYDLNINIHNYDPSEYNSELYIPDEKTISNIVGPSYDMVSTSSKSFKKSNNVYIKYREIGKTNFSLIKQVKNPLDIIETVYVGSGIKGKKKKNLNLYLNKPPQNKKTFIKNREYINERFIKYKWDNIKFENNCIENENKEKESRLITFTPTQDFVSKYFQNSSYYKGLLLWHSVGTGKTCSAISIASLGFEPHDYTILWVTRHTLKTDIWKNIYGSVCSHILRRRIINGENIPTEMKKNPLKYLSKSWIIPISYKQFSNMLNGKNEFYNVMKKRNGSTDILRKTLIIIDEVHKLYSTDLPPMERPNMTIIKNKIKESYKISGENSVRLLLMTATPYTNNPMDLIKLINLMKEDEDIPEDYEDFSKIYLDANGKFTNSGAELYLNNITGYISYLNRERDTRQFAYPVYYNVSVNASTIDIEELEECKKNIELIETNIKVLEENLINKTKEEIKNIKKDIKILKLELKPFAAKLKKLSSKTNLKEDLSQENAFNKCISKK